MIKKIFEKTGEAAKNTGIFLLKAIDKKMAEEIALLTLDHVYQQSKNYFDGQTLVFFDQMNIIKKSYKK